MKTNKLLFILNLVLTISFVSASLNVSLSNQGTNVTTKSTGDVLTLGDLQITVWDSLTGGNLIYNETFLNAIVGGAWNVMIGENSSNPLPLEFGKIYYYDYHIEGNDLNFTNYNGTEVGRQFFYSPLGDISDEDISDSTNLTLGQKIVFALGGFIQNIISGQIDVNGSLNVTGSFTVNENITAGWFKGNLNWSDVQNAPTPDWITTYNATYDNYNVNTTGGYVLVGEYAGSFNTGNDLTAIGYKAGFGNTENENTIVGSWAGTKSAGAIGRGNTMMGYAAGYDSDGAYNVHLGYQVGYGSVGDTNIFIGEEAGIDSKINFSIGIGQEAGRDSTGEYNVFIGYEAGNDLTISNAFILKQSRVNKIPLIQGNFSSGFVGIGTTSPTTTLDVNGSVNITGDLWVQGQNMTVPDYVFEEKYDLMGLDELEVHIGEYQTLPDSEIQGNFFNASVTKKQYYLLEKVEEIILYIFRIDDKVEVLEEESEIMKEENRLMREDLCSLGVERWC